VISFRNAERSFAIKNRTLRIKERLSGNAARHPGIEVSILRIEVSAKGNRGDGR
jgi:hypothetical protein